MKENKECILWNEWENSPISCHLKSGPFIIHYWMSYMKIFVCITWNFWHHMWQNGQTFWRLYIFWQHNTILYFMRMHRTATVNVKKWTRIKWRTNAETMHDADAIPCYVAIDIASIWCRISTNYEINLHVNVWQ